jgi:hypothetical protein
VIAVDIAVDVEPADSEDDRALLAHVRETIAAAGAFIDTMRAAGGDMGDVDAAWQALRAGVDQHNVLPRLETLEIAMEDAMQRLAASGQVGSRER